MFDFMRDRGTGAGDKNLEALGAYLDNALTPAERERLEAQLARDATLRAELEQLRIMKLQLRAMPRRRAPRSFALNPDLYGRPKAQPLLQLYPVLRGATALAAFLLIFTVALGIFQGQFSAGGDAAPAAQVSMVESAAEEAAAPAEESEPFAEDESPTQRDIAPTEKAEGLLAAPAIEAATETPAEESAAEGDLTVAAAPPPEATPDAAGGRSTATSAPEGETPAQEAAPAAEPTVAVAEATATIAPTEVIADIAIAVAEEADSPAATTNSSFLLPLQIALGILFLLLLILWLIARRRARSL